MRRMKEAGRYQEGMSFYMQMPDSYTLVLNTDHPLVKNVLEQTEQATAEELKPIASELRGLEARLQVLRQSTKDKKQEEIEQETKDDIANTEKAMQEQRNKKKDIVAACAAKNQVVSQLIDLALLQNGMLKGARLTNFLKRSIALIKQ